MEADRERLAGKLTEAFSASLQEALGQDLRIEPPRSVPPAKRRLPVAVPVKHLSASVRKHAAPLRRPIEAVKPLAKVHRHHAAKPAASIAVLMLVGYLAASQLPKRLSGLGGNKASGQVAGVSTAKPTLSKEQTIQQEYPESYAAVAFADTQWSTYADSDFGVSLQYPKNATHIAHVVGGDNLWFLRNDGYLLKITRLDAPTGQSLSDWWTLNGNGYVSDSAPVQTSFIGLPAWSVPSVDKSATSGSLYFVKPGAEVYEVWVKDEPPATDDGQRLQGYGQKSSTDLMQIYSNLSATLFAVSCLTLGWWSILADRQETRRFFLGLAAVSLLAAGVGWSALRDAPVLWPYGAGLASVPYLLLFGRRLNRLPASARRPFRAFASTAAILACLIAALGSRHAAASTDVAGAALAAAGQNDRKALAAAALGTESDLNLSAGRLQLSQHFDRLLYLDSSGTVRFDSAGTGWTGSALSQHWPWFSPGSGGAVTLPDGHLAELQIAPSGDGTSVALRYLTPQYLAGLDPGRGIATATAAGVTAAAPNPIPSGVWQSADLDSFARNLAVSAPYLSRLECGGQQYVLSASPLPTLDGSRAYLLRISHA